MKKATQRTDRQSIRSLRAIVNIGPSIEGDLERLGIQHPQQLIGADPWKLYRRLCQLDRKRHDPCVIDVFMAAVDYMSGNPPKPWWRFTTKRKQISRRTSGNRSE